MAKQATHVGIDKDNITVEVCEWGGYMVTSRDRACDFRSGVAAFTTAEECADWVRSFLRNAAARKFGARKTSLSR